MNPLEFIEHLKGYHPAIRDVRFINNFNMDAQPYIQVEIAFHTTPKIWVIAVNTWSAQYNPHNLMKNLVLELDKILEKIPPMPKPQDFLGKFGLSPTEMAFLTKTAQEFANYEAKKAEKLKIDSIIKNGKCTCPACSAGLYGLPVSLGPGGGPAIGDTVREAILDNCPGTKEIVDKCPLCSYSKASLLDMVIHINDNHAQWTRHDIADWLESLDINIEFGKRKEITGG